MHRIIATLAILALLAPALCRAEGGKRYYSVTLLDDVTITNASVHTAIVDLNEYEPINNSHALQVWCPASGHGGVAAIGLEVSSDRTQWTDNIGVFYSTALGTMSTNDLSKIKIAGYGNTTNFVNQVTPYPFRYIRLTFTATATATNTMSAALCIH